MSKQPRPCPHCGGTDFVIVDRSYGGGGKVLTCQDLDCIARIWGLDEEDVIARWNRRAPGPATKEALVWAKRVLRGGLPDRIAKQILKALIDEWK